MEKFLIFETEQEMLALASREAAAIGSDWAYAGCPMYTTDNKYALVVTGFTTLTAEEQAQVKNQNQVNLQTI